MKFDLIRIDGFGRLVNVAFSLAPGLNIFCGPNEIGKSTLQQAIFALLYGFYSRNKRLQGETHALERFKPWQDTAYGGQLVYRLDSGKAFRVARSFDDDLTTSLADAETGRDVSTTFERGRLGLLDFASKHFGMSQDVFINTCFVRQSDLHHLEDAAEQITETVVNLADTGNRDRSVVRAQNKLEKALKEQVGSKQARKAPLPMAHERLQLLNAEKIAVEAQRQRLEADYQARARLKSEWDERATDKNRLRYLLSNQQANALSGKIADIERLLADEESLRQQLDGLNHVTNFPLESRETVMRLSQNWRAHVERLVRLEFAAGEAHAQVSAWQNELTSLREQKRGLESARGTPLEQEPRLRELERTWNEKVRAYRQAEENRVALEQAVADELPTRAMAEKRKALLAMGAARIHDLRMQWESLRARLTEAETQSAQAETTWRVQAMSVEQFNQLSERLGSSTLANLKNEQSRSDTLGSSMRTSSSAKLALPLLILALTLTGVGLASILSGLLSATIFWTLIGLILIVTAIFTGVMSGYVRHRGRNARAGASEVSQMAGDTLKRTGYRSIQELEVAYLSYLQARPLYDNWRAQEANVKKLRDEVQVAESPLSALLLDESDRTPTTEKVVALEQEAQRLSQQLERLQVFEQQQAHAAQDAHAHLAAAKIVEQQINEILKAAGLAGPDVAANLRSFFVMCEQRRQLDTLDAQFGTLEARTEAKLSGEKEVKLEHIEREATERRLAQILGELGIATDNLDAALKEYDRRVEQAERREKITKTLQAHERERNALLPSRTLEQIKAHRASLVREREVALAAHPDFAGLASQASDEALQVDLNAVQDRLMTVKSDLAAVETRLQSGSAGQCSPAEVEEEILVIQELIGRLQFQGQALELAQQHLAAATDEHHRNFLPRLNQIVGSSLASITGGRYSKVQIDHADLQVRVEVPERSEPVTPDLLSRGAQEQIYLLLRLGLTELMSDGRERLPLILDDPLVNYDHDRLLHALDFLAKLAERSQILLFTKDEVTTQWFESQHANSELHRLHRLQ